MELKPVRDFKFSPTWYHSTDQHEFEVEYLGGKIGIVWQRRDGAWSFKRANRSKYAGKFKNRIAAARALADEPVSDPATRYPKRKRSRRKSLTAGKLLQLGDNELWESICESLSIDHSMTV